MFRLQYFFPLVQYFFLLVVIFFSLVTTNKKYQNKRRKHSEKRVQYFFNRRNIFFNNHNIFFTRHNISKKTKYNISCNTETPHIATGYTTNFIKGCITSCNTFEIWRRFTPSSLLLASPPPTQFSTVCRRDPGRQIRQRCGWKLPDPTSMRPRTVRCDGASVGGGKRRKGSNLRRRLGGREEIGRRAEGEARSRRHSWGRGGRR